MGLGMTADEVGKEIRDMIFALLVVLLVGLSLSVDLERPFGLGALDAIALCLSAFLAHELAHKLCARHIAGGGRFRLALTGSLFSLLAAGIQNLTGFILTTLNPAAEPLRLAPYRFLAPGMVVVKGRRTRRALGGVALAGPASNLGLGWLMLALGLASPLGSELLLLGAALNAYTAITALLPLAFCDGLTIYWWSRKALVVSLGLSIILIVISNAALLLGW